MKNYESNTVVITLQANYDFYSVCAVYDMNDTIIDMIITNLNLLMTLQLR